MGNVIAAAARAGGIIAFLFNGRVVQDVRVGCLVGGAGQRGGDVPHRAVGRGGTTALRDVPMMEGGSERWPTKGGE